MGLLLSVARKFKEYAITVFAIETDIAWRDSKANFVIEAAGASVNSNAYEVYELRMSALNGIMEAMTDTNINLVGVYGTESSEKATLLEKVSRKAMRDNLFDVVVMATVTKKPDLRMIQEQLSDMLGLKLEKKKDVAERARCLCDKIKEQHKILVVLCHLRKKIDLGQKGTPMGKDHKGCKILLTSTSEEILSNQMHTQKNFNV